MKRGAIGRGAARLTARRAMTNLKHVRNFLFEVTRANRSRRQR